MPHVAEQTKLSAWSLTVDGWSGPDNGSVSETKHTTYGPMEVAANAEGKLPTWSSINPDNGFAVDLTDVSGVGTYTASLEVAKGTPGGYLDLGGATDSVALWVNGKRVVVNQQNIRRIDVGRHLKVGTNVIKIRVASTLLNAVRVTPGASAQARVRNETYGLNGPVTFRPYGQARVRRLCR